MRSAEKVLDGPINRAGGAKDKTGVKRGSYKIGGISERTARTKRLKMANDVVATNANPSKAPNTDLQRRKKLIIARPKPQSVQTKLSSFFSATSAAIITNIASTRMSGDVVGRESADVNMMNQDLEEVEYDGDREEEESVEEAAESGDIRMVVEDGAASVNDLREHASKIQVAHDRSREGGVKELTEGEGGEGLGSDHENRSAQGNEIESAARAEEEGQLDEDIVRAAGEIEKELDRNMEEVDALEWINDILEDATSTDPVELEALACEGLKLSRKAKIYHDEVIFANLIDFYHWTPRQGRVKASAWVAQNLGRGPAFACKLSKQARFFEKNGAIEPSRQGKKEMNGGMIEDERVEIGVQRMLRTVETGKVCECRRQFHRSD